MGKKEKATDLVSAAAPGFKERVTPASTEALAMLKCPDCGGVHFRHAGYINLMLPFMRSGGEKRVDLHEVRVMICVSCKRSHVWANEQLYDVTEHVDLTAWVKTEREAHRATGPGGQC